MFYWPSDFSSEEINNQNLKPSFMDNKHTICVVTLMSKSIEATIAII